ncbi:MULTISPECIES: metal ABC transporter permease [Citricoccus]|uniref:metal ABC transporter permease n=1 Tax=Citricoccus TaxID=169133 RepID=UPI000255EE0F|nr:metal ABC transporter permease [Citricoccus sp. CH26A]
MTPLELLLEPLQYDFMVRALATAAIAAVVCSLLSCWLVLVGWSLMGDAVSHAVLPGVVIAYVLGVPFALGALVFGFLAVALIGGLRDTSRVKEDAAIGIVFTTLFALGLVLISVTPSQTDLNHIIFGNILGVSTAELVQIGVLAAVAFAVLVIKRRDLTLYAFDPTHAHAIGLNPRRLGALLLGVLALTCVVTLQVVGVILVVALLIIPGATAYLLTDRFGRMLVIAPLVSVACSVVGIYLSYWLDAASGGLVVLVHGAVFALVYLFGPRHGLLGRYLTRRRHGPAGVGPPAGAAVPVPGPADTAGGASHPVPGGSSPTVASAAPR